MQNRPFITVWTLAVALLAGTSAQTAFSVDIVDDPVQIDELAENIVSASNSLCWEMYRYHQQQPGYADSYRLAKRIWSSSGQLREALASGPVETEVMRQRVTEINQLFVQLEKSTAQWGPGDQSALKAGGEPRTIVQPGVGIDVPFVGRLGNPSVVVVDDQPQLQRLRLHPNSHGSKRSLERELAAVKVAIGYLVEDAATDATSSPPTPLSTEPGPVPQPPTPKTTLER